MDPATIAVLADVGLKLGLALIGVLAARGAAATVDENVLDETLDQYKMRGVVKGVGGNRGKANK